MAELNRTDLNTLFDLPFKKANPTLIARIKTLIESAWNKVDDAGGSGGLSLGETSTTAYRGDRGKTAYDHSQAAHAPSDAVAQANTYTDSLASAVSSALAGKLDTPTGTPDGTKYLRDDNTWQPIAGGSGLEQYQVRRMTRR